MHNLSIPSIRAHHPFRNVARRFLPSLATRLHEVVDGGRIHANKNSHARTSAATKLPAAVPSFAHINGVSSSRISQAKYMYFNSDYRERAVLANGSVATLRLVRPTDHDLWVDGFSRLSPDSRYFRFCTAKSRLSEKEIRYFTVVDQETHFAIVAVREDPDGHEIGLGVARFIRFLDDPTRAEPAITVTDDAQRHGLGYLLGLRLVAAARERDIAYFDANVLGSNSRVIRMMKDIAPDTVLRRYGGEIVMTSKLPNTDPRETWAHLHEAKCIGAANA